MFFNQGQKGGSLVRAVDGIAQLLMDYDINKLLSIIGLLAIHQVGGQPGQAVHLKRILIPMDKALLATLTALLICHHFATAKEQKRKKGMKKGMKVSKDLSKLLGKQKGGAILEGVWNTFTQVINPDSFSILAILFLLQRMLEQRGGGGYVEGSSNADDVRGHLEGELGNYTHVYEQHRTGCLNDNWCAECI